MPQVDFDILPATARLWIFSADRPLNDDERSQVLHATDAFLATWAAHGAPLTAGREFRHDRFLLVGVDEASAGVSGCSIDALVRTLKQLESELGVTLLDHGPVSYRHGERIERISRAQFAERVSAGAIDSQTTVFNNTIATVGDLRSGKWESAAEQSWHGKVFF